MSETKTTNNKTIILPYQKSIFERLCATGRACLYTKRDKATIGIKLRANFLLVGPSGSGKTFIASELARELQVPFIFVSTSDWILLSCSNRGGVSTWPTIFDFIERSIQKQGAIIFIDELDKCYHDSNWNTFLRSEIFSLCDYRIPANINDSDMEPIQESRIAAAQSFLENKTMIIAGAAFQDVWDQKSRPLMGFTTGEATSEMPEVADLIKILPRELINRFSADLFVLPELTEIDYFRMVDTVASRIPEVWRGKFLELGHARIAEAVANRKGARYMEEIMLAAIMAERASMTDFVPSAMPSERVEDKPEWPDLQIF